MSKLATLGIYKIRSYGGDQLQTVSFLKNPVTLILGDNGCGKTVSAISNPIYSLRHEPADLISLFSSLLLFLSK